MNENIKIYFFSYIRRKIGYKINFILTLFYQ